MIYQLRKISYECNTGDRTLEIITKPAAGFYTPPEAGAFHTNPFFLN